MGQAEIMLDRLSGVARQPIDRWGFVTDLEPLARTIEREFDAEGGRIHVLFADTPTAADLAKAVVATDRHARRVAAAFEHNLRPEQLHGRGMRLIPTSRGLHVERADPGSLDLALLFGGLYQAITSQPLSFALNLVTLLGGGRTVFRALDPKRRNPPQEITIDLPWTPIAPRGGEPLEETVDEGPPPSRSALVRVPSRYRAVRIRVTASDGTTIEVDCTT